LTILLAPTKFVEIKKNSPKILKIGEKKTSLTFCEEKSQFVLQNGRFLQ